MKLLYFCVTILTFFEFNANPSVNWHDVDTKLKQLGAKEVYHIEAEKCIEDIFLIDIIGICKYLNIPYVKRINDQNVVEYFCGETEYIKKGLPVRVLLMP